MTQKQLENDIVFFNAVSGGNIKQVKDLISTGIDVNILNEDGDTALIIASKNDHLEIVKVLIAAGADANIKSRHGTALTIVSKIGHLEIIKTLITTGADINFQNSSEKNRFNYSKPKWSFRNSKNFNSC